MPRCRFDRIRACRRRQLALVGCRDAAPRRPIAIVVSGDTAGWIVPCGCTTNQSGGLPRRATYVRELAKEHDVLVLDAGGAPGGMSPYRAASSSRRSSPARRSSASAAHNVGAAEAALGAEALRQLAGKSPLVSTNLRDDGRQADRRDDPHRDPARRTILRSSASCRRSGRRSCSAPKIRVRRSCGQPQRTRGSTIIWSSSPTCRKTSCGRSRRRSPRRRS